MLRCSIVVIVALASLASCEKAEEDEVCQEVRKCFLDKDEDIAQLAALGSGDTEGKYKNFAAGAEDWRAAYGEGGTCYDEDRALCRGRCLCTLRQLCLDPDVRDMLCERNFQGTDKSSGRCCDDEALRELEEELVDENDDGKDDLCDLPVSSVVPPNDEMCQ